MTWLVLDQILSWACFVFAITGVIIVIGQIVWEEADERWKRSFSKGKSSGSGSASAVSNHTHSP